MCGDTFEYAYTLQRHLKEQHKDQLYSANSTGVTHCSTALQAKKKKKNPASTGQILSTPDYMCNHQTIARRHPSYTLTSNRRFHSSYTQ